MSDENSNESLSVFIIKCALSIFFTCLALLFIYTCLVKPFLMNDCSTLYNVVYKIESIFKINMPYALKNLCI